MQKLKLSLLPITADTNNPMDQSQLEVSTCHWHEARKKSKVHEQVTIGFGFTSDWLRKWRASYKPITER